MRNKKSPFIILLAMLVVIVCVMLLWNGGKDEDKNEKKESATEETTGTEQAGKQADDSEEKINNIVKKAEEYREKNDYNSAIATIESGLVAYPDSQVLLSKKETYELAKEKYEADLEKTKTAQTAQNTSQSTSQGTSRAAGLNTPEPFYGIWCEAYKNESNAQSAAKKYINKGIDARVFVTTDWSNLNRQKWYIVSAGVYASKEEAKAALPAIKNHCSDAYVKYSGSWQGAN